MNRRKLRDPRARRFNNFGRPPKRVRRSRQLREGSDQAPRREDGDGGDEKRADEDESQRPHQPSALSPEARLDRQPAAVVEICGDEEDGRGQQILSGPKRSARQRRGGVSRHNGNGVFRCTHSDGLHGRSGGSAEFAPNGRQHSVQRPRRVARCTTRRRAVEANGKRFGVRQVCQNARWLGRPRHRILDDFGRRAAQPTRAVQGVKIGRVREEHKSHQHLNGDDRRCDRGANPCGETKPPKQSLDHAVGLIA